MEDLNRSLCTQMNMLTEVYLREASFAKQAYQLIIPKLLTCTISHEPALLLYSPHCRDPIYRVLARAAAMCLPVALFPN